MKILVVFYYLSAVLFTGNVCSCMKEGESIDTREHGNSRIDGRVDTVVELPIYSLVDNEWIQSAYVGY